MVDEKMADDEEESAEEQEKEHTALKSIAHQINAKIVALSIAGLIVGILIGQVAMPGLGVGLIAMPAETAEPCVQQGLPSTDELKANLEAYLEENIFGPQGLEGQVLSIADYDSEFYSVEIEAFQDGESLGVQDVYVTKSGNALVPAPIFLSEAVEPVEPGETIEPEGPANVGTLGSFIDSGESIETVDGKPVVRLFTTTWCPHCTWIKETYDSVVKEYIDAGKIVAYHWELDTGDDSITEEVESEVPPEEDAVYRHFNPRGSIPTFVFGGRYYRVGNGYESQSDLEAEEADFRMLIDSLIEEAGK